MSKLVKAYALQRRVRNVIVVVLALDRVRRKNLLLGQKREQDHKY